MEYRKQNMLARTFICFLQFIILFIHVDDVKYFAEFHQKKFSLQEKNILVVFFKVCLLQWLSNWYVAKTYNQFLLTFRCVSISVSFDDWGTLYKINTIRGRKLATIVFGRKNLSTIFPYTSIGKHEWFKITAHTFAHILWHSCLLIFFINFNS